MYELGRFITEELKARGIKRSEFVKRLGYTNLNRGLRALDRCINQGNPHPFIVQNLPKALNVDPSVIEKIVQTTRQQRLDEREARKRKRLDEREARERERFKPHLRIITERQRPTFITGAIITGIAEKKVELPPDITSLSFEEQLDHVKSIVQSHYAQAEGTWPFFGKIVGYYYFHHFRENVRLDIEGNVERKETTHFVEPKGYLTIGNKKISGGLLQFSNKDQGELEGSQSTRIQSAKKETGIE